MPFFLLHHQHAAHECAAAFAAWQGFDSPRPCLWWRVEAANPREALALLPTFVAKRTNPIQFREVEIP